MPKLTTPSLRLSFDLDDPTTLQLDLDHPNPKDVLALVEIFAEAAKEENLEGLQVETGWNEITQEVAIGLLKRNKPGANRKVDPGTVLYYADQMASGEWKATGQPILFDTEGRLQDGQHRLLACVVSGVTFDSYVVTEIEPIPGLFAYIDNARARTPATALQTAGFNGVAPVIARVIKIAEEVRQGVYNPSGAAKLKRLSPALILSLARDFPNAQRAARSAASDWSDAVEFLGRRRDIVAYLGMRIIDLYDEETADEFFEAIMDESLIDGTLDVFRKFVEKDNRAARRIKRQHMLAALIIAFNAWHAQEPLPRRWMMMVHEDFPVLYGPDDQPDEAAA